MLILLLFSLVSCRIVSSQNAIANDKDTANQQNMPKYICGVEQFRFFSDVRKSFI